MTSRVTDPRSNSPEQLVFLAKAVGRSDARIAVFRFIHKGKKKLKSVSEIVAGTKLPRKRVLDEAKKLVNKEVVKQDKKDGEIAYEKDPFCYTNREKIISYAKNPKKLKKVPTKHNPAPVVVRVAIRAPKALVRSAILTVDNIDQFAKARKAKGPHRPLTISETRFKNGVKKLLGEFGKFKDWGGETSDLFTSRLKIKNVRHTVAFAFKGPGTKGILTPGLLGKNGDQIQRLFIEDADVYFVQYVGQVASSVQQQMAVFAQSKSLSTGRKIYYGVIDGEDSARLVSAYPKAFK
jgi:hypothetical protein